MQLDKHLVRITKKFNYYVCIPLDYNYHRLFQQINNEYHFQLL